MQLEYSQSSHQSRRKRQSENKQPQDIGYRQEEDNEAEYVYHKNQQKHPDKNQNVKNI